VALIERDRLGGTCLNYGCDPSKALLHAAESLFHARHDAPLGVEVSGARLNWSQARRRVRQLIEDIRGGSHEDAVAKQRNRGIEIYLGEASFMTPNTVRVNGRELYGERIIIAAGHEPIIPPIPGLREGGCLTNKDLLEFEELPESLAIIGAGFIGTEYAQMMARFGVDVILLEMMEQVLPNADPAMTAPLAGYLRADGVRIECGAEITEAQSRNGRRVLTWRQDGQDASAEVEAVMATAGRAPDLETLQPEKAGIELEGRQIRVDDALRTSVPHIWAAGDVAGAFPFTHVASAQGKLAMRNAFADDPQAFDWTGIPWVAYMEPALAHVGASYAEICAEADRFEQTELDLERIPRRMIMGGRAGKVKITARKDTGALAAVDILAPHAGELIGTATVAVRHGLPASALADTILPYPTLVQSLQFAAGDLDVLD
jgi:pyruvate/2-oxoglutarate dehydrogenase complex dihydrolipoamide dehydrogenase (E3) component